jgi:hypothetical protein
MKFVNGGYTQRVNRLHRWDGLVFNGRFASKFVPDETRLPLPYILAYIHLNPLLRDKSEGVSGPKRRTRVIDKGVLSQPL